MNRRALLRNSAMIAAAGALPGLASAAPYHPSVVARLQVYSNNIVPRTMPDRSVHVLASIDNMEAFSNLAARIETLPYDRIMACGNTLSFTYHGTAYRIENVLPQDFSPTLASPAPAPNYNSRSI